MPNQFYITTAIDYVNSVPHIGHAFEKVQADVLARYHRALGDDVFFLTGSDEHGAKIARAAAAAGVPVRQFVNSNTKIFKKLTQKLNISNDYFLRTSDRKNHWPAVIKIWKELAKSGDLYKKQYAGFYCVGHEAFVTKKDLMEGKCALHKTEPEIIKEENYFFRLSRYEKQIEEKIKSGEFKIVPESAKNEILSLAKEGLEDVSFSRPRKDLKWGVPVPDDSTQTIYVWCDALTNYLSAAGYGSKLQKYWPPDVQIIGKDILRFHAAIWPGMLLSAGLPLPKTLFVHGFISVGGEKMSKTIGNVVDPFVLIEKYGTDAVRYYLLREIPPTRDGDFTYEKFDERYKADLAKGLGNFTARVINLGARHIKEELPSYASASTKKAIEKAKRKYDESLNDFRFDEALQAIWELISYGDKFVDKSRLWELPKKDPEKFTSSISELCVILANVAASLQPFLSKTSSIIAKQLGIKFEGKEEWKFKLKKGAVLFPLKDGKNHE